MSLYRTHGKHHLDEWRPILLWWSHQMETYTLLLALRAGNSPVTGGFPSQRPVTRTFDVFFDLCRNTRLSKQSRRRCFESSLWRHCNNISYMCNIDELKRQQTADDPISWRGQAIGKYCVWLIKKTGPWLVFFSLPSFWIIFPWRECWILFLLGFKPIQCTKSQYMPRIIQNY